MGCSLTRVTVLGSTGSIGTQTLDVIRSLNGRFELLGLAAGRNFDLLARQAREFRPPCSAAMAPTPTRFAASPAKSARPSCR